MSAVLNHPEWSFLFESGEGATVIWLWTLKPVPPERSTIGRYGPI
jgi:hypothetical protein